MVLSPFLRHGKHMTLKHVLEFKTKSPSHGDLTVGVGERQNPEWPTSPVAGHVLTMKKNTCDAFLCFDI